MIIVIISAVHYCLSSLTNMYLQRSAFILLYHTKKQRASGDVIAESELVSERHKRINK